MDVNATSNSFYAALGANQTPGVRGVYTNVDNNGQTPSSVLGENQNLGVVLDLNNAIADNSQGIYTIEQLQASMSAYQAVNPIETASVSALFKTIEATAPREVAAPEKPEPANTPAPASERKMETAEFNVPEFDMSQGVENQGTTEVKVAEANTAPEIPVKEKPAVQTEDKTTEVKQTDLEQLYKKATDIFSPAGENKGTLGGVLNAEA